jgi:hypothetical protein
MIPLKNRRLDNVRHGVRKKRRPRNESTLMASALASLSSAPRPGKRRGRLGDRLPPHQPRRRAVAPAEERHQAALQNRLAGALAEPGLGAGIEVTFAVFGVC